MHADGLRCVRETQYNDHWFLTTKLFRVVVTFAAVTPILVLLKFGQIQQQHRPSLSMACHRSL